MSDQSEKKMNHEKEEDQMSTWVKDPSGLEGTSEILEAQNSSDELVLDTDLEENLELPPDTEADQKEINSHQEDSLELQLEKISQAISAQTALDQKEEIETINPEDIVSLESQIAEDQALEKELAAEQLAQLAQEEGSEENASSVFASLPNLDEQEIQSCIETLIFLADKPISAKKLQEHLGPEFDLSLFNQAIQCIQERYQSMHHGFELVEVAGGFQFRTKPGRAALAQRLSKIQTHRLSTGGMETLAIIAYQQPLMKEEVDKIRGVDSSYFIRGLMEKKLIQITGRSELPGRPLLYSTTSDFLEVFGLKDLGALPPLRELEQMIPSSQSKNPADEDPRVRTMRKLVNEMNSDKKGALDYDPREDEKILKEFREKVTSIPSSTPYLDELKAAEELAKAQAKNPLAE